MSSTKDIRSDWNSCRISAHIWVYWCESLCQLQKISDLLETNAAIWAHIWGYWGKSLCQLQKISDLLETHAAIWAHIWGYWGKSLCHPQKISDLHETHAAIWACIGVNPCVIYKKISDLPEIRWPWVHQSAQNSWNVLLQILGFRKGWNTCVKILVWLR